MIQNCAVHNFSLTFASHHGMRLTDALAGLPERMCFKS